MFPIYKKPNQNKTEEYLCINKRHDIENNLALMESRQQQSCLGEPGLKHQIGI